MTASPHRLLGFIPARAGSRRVPDKNARPCGGSDLISRTVRTALASSCLDAVGFSSDSERYVGLARAAGLAVDYLRPAAVAGDATTTAETVVDYLHHLERGGDAGFSHVVLLQPTSPLRTADEIDRAVSEWRGSGRSSLVSATPASPEPHFVLLRSEDEQATLTRDPATAERLFVLDGSIFITPVEMIVRDGRFWDADSHLFVNQYPRPWDIDTEADFRAAAAILSQA